MSTFDDKSFCFRVNDAAIIRLAEDVPFSQTLYPACLPDIGGPNRPSFPVATVVNDLCSRRLPKERRWEIEYRFEKICIERVNNYFGVEGEPFTNTTEDGVQIVSGANVYVLRDVIVGTRFAPCDILGWLKANSLAGKCSPKIPPKTTTTTERPSYCKIFRGCKY